MQYIDTHAHIYQSELKNDLDNIVSKAHANGVEKIIMPNVDSSSIDDMLDCELRYPKACYATIGLHPCYVKENFEEELAIVKAWLEKRKFCAIGEVGIDLYHDTTYKIEQEVAFTRQIEWALYYDMPIIIHTRNAFYDAVKCLKTFGNVKFRGVFHCFGGSLQDAEVALQLGFKLGIGGTVTYKNSGLNEVLKHIDLKDIILETDAPYLTPVPHRGKQNESSYIPLIAQKISEIKGITVEEVAHTTTLAAQRLFCI